MVHAAAMTATPVDLAELAEHHGALDDDFAVFGTTGAPTEPLPRWASDAHEIEARIRRKRRDDPNADLWPVVATLVRDLATVVDAVYTIPPESAADAATRAATTSGWLARRLPIPPKSLLRRAAGPPRHRANSVAAATSTLEAAAVALLRAIDELSWVDTDALAGWIADARPALAWYRASLPPRRHQARTQRTGARRAPVPRSAHAHGSAAT